MVAEETLQIAMLAILGPEVINEKKFSFWESKIEVLGLIFDTIESSVSMPADKIQKALSRVNLLRDKPFTSKSELQRLLGSPRHVCTCLRSAKPFYQKLQQACNRSHNLGKIRVMDDMLLDLSWFNRILSLGRLQHLPTALFCANQEADVHIYMDASNKGLAVIDPSKKRYIQVQFDLLESTWTASGSKTTDFNINVRELFSVALAAILFGPSWTNSNKSSITLVRAWIDNTAAVSWSNRLSSPNPMAQELNRAIGLAEAILGSELPVNTFQEVSTQWRMRDPALGTHLILNYGLTILLDGARSSCQKRFGKSIRNSPRPSDQIIGR